MNRISDFTLNLLAGSESVPAEVASIAKELQEYRKEQPASRRVTELTMDLDKMIARAELQESRAKFVEDLLREMREVTLSDMQDRAELAEVRADDAQQDAYQWKCRSEQLERQLKASEGKRKVLEMQLAECGKQLNDARKAADTWKRAADASGGKKLLTKDEHMELERIVRQSRVAPAAMLQVIDRIRVDE